MVNDQINDFQKGLLDGVRVVEFGGKVSAPYCGLNLSGLGAEVIKVEPLSGDVSRKIGPFPSENIDTEKSALYLALNRGKKSVTADLTNASDVKALKNLVRTADVIIENCPLGFLKEYGFDYHELSKVNPTLIYGSILPFGDSGPYSSYLGDDLTIFHMSSVARGMASRGEIVSDKPVRSDGYQSDLVSGMAATTAIMLMIFNKFKSGAGGYVVISSFEAMVTMVVSGLAGVIFEGGEPVPSDDHGDSSSKPRASAILGLLPCRDGYAAISPRENSQWERWVTIMGNPVWANEERFATQIGRNDNEKELWEHMSEWTKTRSKFEVARVCQEKRVPCFPVNTIEDLLADDHLNQREFFLTLNHPIAGEFDYPGFPYKISDATLPRNKEASPILGQNNDMLRASGYLE